ncbi:2199_t:CDS:2, partial [Entrophospora sp. SA101]
VLAPAKRAVKNIEAKSSNMASCFLELVKMAIAIKNLPSSLDTNFKRQCIRIFNKRWEKLDVMTYLLTFFFHPKYRAKGFQNTIFREMSLFAMKIWTDFGGGTNSCKILMAQIRKYSENYPPYDMEYIDNHDTPEIWWATCRQPDNFIQQLALKLFAVVPHQVACERVFSVLDWMIGKRRTRIDTTRLQSMAQIHSFYITNAKTELNYPNSDLTDDELDTTIQEITAAMAEDDDLFEYSEDNDLFEYGEEEEGEDQNEEEDESLGLNNDILFMEDIMNLSLGFDENGNEDESTTRNEQEIFDH